MQHRQLGRSKIQISAIIFGGWQAGKSGWTGIDDAETRRRAPGRVRQRRHDL